MRRVVQGTDAYTSRYSTSANAAVKARNEELRIYALAVRPNLIQACISSAS